MAYKNPLPVYTADGSYCLVKRPRNLLIHELTTITRLIGDKKNEIVTTKHDVNWKSIKVKVIWKSSDSGIQHC